jgi:hypothetical protein
METEIDTQNIKIPAAYQHLKKTIAAEIMDIPTSSFYRKYLDTGMISLSMDIKGKERIAFSELVRVFGEQAIKNLHKHINSLSNPSDGKNGDIENFPETDWKIYGSSNFEIERVRFEEQIKGLQQRLSDKEDWIRDRDKQLEEKNQLIQEQRGQIQSLESKVYGLLENKKTPPDNELKELKKQFNEMKQAQENKSWLAKFFKL